MPLTNIQVDKAKPEAKDRKLFDEKGLYLLVKSGGHKWWRFKYRFGSRADGKPGKAEKVLALGVYPEVSLKRAREKRDEARRLLSDGIDPSAERKAAEETQRVAHLGTFEAVAREWLKRQSWGESHGAKNIRRLEQHVFPWIGQHALANVKRADIRGVLRRIEGTGRVETAYRVLQLCRAIFEYAIAEEICEHTPCNGLSKTLLPRSKRHHASITDPKKVGELMRAIGGFSGTLPVACALRLAPLLFVRPGELRKADWSEFDLDGAHPQWRIPAPRMKMREQHIVPLAKQAVAILRELHPLTGPDGYVFPSVRNASRPMSENTLNVSLRRLGYDRDTMTAHGFRSLASSLLNEQQWNKDAIERQLAHGERDKVRAAYNQADYLSERRKMMQSWADYLDTLRAGAEIITRFESLKRA
jgi:integrase